MLRALWSGQYFWEGRAGGGCCGCGRSGRRSYCCAVEGLRAAGRATARRQRRAFIVMRLHFRRLGRKGDGRSDRTGEDGGDATDSMRLRGELAMLARHLRALADKKIGATGSRLSVGRKVTCRTKSLHIRTSATQPTAFDSPPVRQSVSQSHCPFAATIFPHPRRKLIRPSAHHGPRRACAAPPHLEQARRHRRSLDHAAELLDQLGGAPAPAP